MSNDTVENDLRAMLTERAGDVDTVPASVFAFEDDHAEDEDGVTLVPGTARRRRTSPLLAAAAAVVAVLAAAGIVVATHGARDEKQVSPANTGVSSPPVRVLPRSAERSWFGIRLPDGYEFGDRASLVDYRTMGLAKIGDDGALRGPGDGTPFQTRITVWRKNASGPSRTVTRWPHVDLPGGRTGYLGRAGLGAGTGFEYATLAFRSADGRWVFVQGRTAASSTTKQLRTVAASLRPDEDVAAPVPFRLRYVPPRTRFVGMYENLTAGHEKLSIALGAPSGRVDIVVAGSVAATGIGTVERQETRTVGGVAVTIDFGRAVAVAQPGDKTAVSFAVSRPGHREPIAEQRYQLDQMLKNVTWRNAQGEPGLPLTQAIP